MYVNHLPPPPPPPAPTNLQEDKRHPGDRLAQLHPHYKAEEQDAHQAAAREAGRWVVSGWEGMEVRRNVRGRDGDRSRAPQSLAPYPPNPT